VNNNSDNSLVRKHAVIKLLKISPTQPDILASSIGSIYKWTLCSKHLLNDAARLPPCHLRRASKNKMADRIKKLWASHIFAKYELCYLSSASSDIPT